MINSARQSHVPARPQRHLFSLFTDHPMLIPTRKLLKFLKEYISEVNEDDGYDIMLLSDCGISSGQQHPC